MKEVFNKNNESLNTAWSSCVHHRGSGYSEFLKSGP
jgi:hypothetical protein